MPKATEKPYQKLLQAHRKRRNKQPDKTNDKIIKAMEKVVESALRALAEEEFISPKEQKEIIGLLMKAVDEMTKRTPADTKPFTPTPTDKALLESYVEQRIAGTLPRVV